MKISNKLITFSETSLLIKQGHTLIIAGEESLLRRLPSGFWIGGSTPYFMTENGGMVNSKKLFVSDLSPIVKECRIESFDKHDIKHFPKNNYKNGFDYILLPAFSEIYAQYALETPNINGLFDVPVYGWVSGTHLDNQQKQSAIVVDGTCLTIHRNKAIVLYIELIEDLSCEMNIINIFSQNNLADEITFKSDSFDIKNCMINGIEQNFHDYIIDNNINTKLPLVSNYNGAGINISIRNLDTKNKIVKLYAPVNKGAQYKFSSPINNYVHSFESKIKNTENYNIALSCNCILNYLYSDLKEEKLNEFKGPFTFGEIAYILVNQTLVYININ